MGKISDKFRKVRLDQSPFLYHFINGSDEDPFKTLTEILSSKKLKSKLGYVCFSASPLTAVKEFFEEKVNRTGKPLYHPYGIGLSRDLLIKEYAAKNVIYVSLEEKNDIPPSFLWRTQVLDVDNYDFEYLREWRIKGEEFDFSKIDKKDILVIAPDENKLNSIVIEFNMEFKPIVNPISGDIEEDWDDTYRREWKGVALNQIGKDYFSDYGISDSLVEQVIGEDMLKQIIKKSPLYYIFHKQKAK